jgi:hypothetical protein
MIASVHPEVVAPLKELRQQLTELLALFRHERPISLAYAKEIVAELNKQVDAVERNVLAVYCTVPADAAPVSTMAIPSNQGDNSSAKIPEPSPPSDSSGKRSRGKDPATKWGEPSSGGS